MSILHVMQSLGVLQMFFATDMCEKYNLTICKDKKKQGELLNILNQIEREVQNEYAKR